MSNRAGIWLAVSSRTQIDASGLERQLEQCQSAIREHGYRATVEIRSDEIEGPLSRSIENLTTAVQVHQGYRELVEAIEGAKFDRLYYAGHDRLGRDTVLIIEVIRKCQRHGIELFDADAGTLIKTENQTYGDRILTLFRSAEAEYYVESLVLRRKEGMVKRARDYGLFPTGDPPYGYRLIRHGHKHDDEYETIPEQKEIILKIYSLYMEGKGTHVIADTLNSLGYRYNRTTVYPRSSGTDVNGHRPPPRYSSNLSWKASNVQRIINRCWQYAGYVEIYVDSKYEYQRFKKASRHESFITESYARKIQNEIDIRAHGKKLGNAKYMISGLIYCEVCKYRCQLTIKKQAGKSYARCRHCANTGNRTTWMLTDIVDIIADALERKMRTLTLESSADVEAVDHKQRIERAIVDNTEKIKRLNGLVISGAIESTDSDFYLEPLNELKREKIQLEQALENIPEPMTPEETGELHDAMEAILSTIYLNTPGINSILRHTIKIRAEQSGVLVVEFI